MDTLLNFVFQDYCFQESLGLLLQLKKNPPPKSSYWAGSGNGRRDQVPLMVTPHYWGDPYRWRSRAVLYRLTDFKRPQLGALLKKTKFTFLIFPPKMKLIVGSKCGTTPPPPSYRCRLTARQLKKGMGCLCRLFLYS